MNLPFLLFADRSPDYRVKFQFKFNPIPNTISVIPEPRTHK